ncbi:MAG: homoserine O-acetyltransferase [Ramlibacter sp.]|jgi:homoserine O-acetyltransferase|nr:homoserine O-acetyltransferase [Ramlibacter sp.]
MLSFDAGPVLLQSGARHPGARLAYTTWGRLDDRRSNAVLLCTPFGAQHPELEWIVQPDGLLDANRYFVIVPNLFGNGLSSSPVEQGGRAEAWSDFTIHDNCAIQHRLVTEVLGIERLALVWGWSMGGQQAYEWGAAYPEMVERIAVLCGSARTAPHNHVFLEGVKTALQHDPEVARGIEGPAHDRAMRAVGRIYAGWALSQAFYRQEVWRTLGFATLEDFLVGYWEAGFLKRNAANLLAHIATWQKADISANARYRGDFGAALSSISARALVMPATTDLYFPPEDNALEVERMPHARLLPIPSVWGHRAGMPVKAPQERAFIRAALAELLAQPPIR